MGIAALATTTVADPEVVGGSEIKRSLDMTAGRGPRKSDQVHSKKLFATDSLHQQGQRVPNYVVGHAPQL